jgi:signal transduction histidine kinase
MSAGAGRSLERSVAATLIVSIAAVMVLALLLAVLLLKETIERRIDQRLSAAAAELQNAVSRPGSGGLTLDETPADPVFEDRGSGWGWLVREGDRILARSRSLGGGGLPQGGAGAVERVRAEDGEVRALTVAIRSTPGLSLTVAAPQQAVWRELAADIRVVAGAIALLGAVLVAVAVWQARRALAPALSLARDLERVREGSLDRLPDSAIQEVAVVHRLINDLLVERRQAAAEARESAAKLAHGLKTPLAVIAARADAGGAAPDAKVMEAVGAMQRLVATNLAAARATRRSRVGRQRTLLRPIVEDLAAAFRHRSLDRGIAAEIDLPVDLAADMPEDEAMEAVGNILDNAFRHARSRVSVALGPSAPDIVALRVEDDGPGFGGAATDRSAGNGLGLTIAMDLLERHGGRLLVGAGTSGGAVVTLSLPRG